MAATLHRLVMPLARRVNPAPRRLTLRLSDGYPAPVFFHEPAAGVPAGLPVVYVHGIQSHPGWYMASARLLADAGHPVYQVTRRGSGDAPDPRGHAANAAQLLDDLADACELAMQRSTAPAVHLAGVSWGGKLVLAYALGRGETVASLTLVAPGLRPRVDVTPGVKLAIAASLLVSPRRMFDIPLNDVDLFTDCPAMRQYLLADNCRLMRASAAFLFASRSLDRILASAPSCSLKMPVTLILARDDRIIDNPATRRLVERLATQLQTRELPGPHTLELGTDPSALLECLRLAVTRSEPRSAG